MSVQAILTLVFAGIGVVIALATAIKAYAEYRQQGVQRRAQMFFDLRHRLQDTELARVSELIDEALCRDPNLSKKAEMHLRRVPLRVKRDYLGLFEEVGVAMSWDLIEPSLANYMFGYYALNCRACGAFWSNINPGSIYWARFYEFCVQMEREDAVLRRRIEADDGWSAEIGRPSGHAALGQPVAMSKAGCSEKASDLQSEAHPAVASGLPVVTVKIPAVLRLAVAGNREIQVRGRTVAEVLLALAERHPAVLHHLFSRSPGGSDYELHRYVNIFYQGEDVRVLDGLQTAVANGGTLAILPAAQGGA